MINVEFSIISHHPSFITGEFINIAILFHDVTNDIRRLEVTRNWKRVEAFDDEADIDFLKLTLQSISDEVTNNLYNYNLRKFNLYEYTKFYVNELKFSEIISAETSDFISFVEETKKIYLRYDFNKKERPTAEQQEQYIKRILEAKNIYYSSGKTTGYVDEILKYDVIIDDKYAIKFISLESKNLSHTMDKVKKWAYNSIKLKNKYKTIFIYDIENPEDEFRKKALKILEDDSFKTLHIKDALPFIVNIKQKESKDNY